MPEEQKKTAESYPASTSTITLNEGGVKLGIKISMALEGDAPVARLKAIMHANKNFLLRSVSEWVSERLGAW